MTSYRPFSPYNTIANEAKFNEFYRKGELPNVQDKWTQQTSEPNTFPKGSYRNYNNFTKTSLINLIYSKSSSLELSSTNWQVRALWPVAPQTPQQCARVSSLMRRPPWLRLSCFNCALTSLSSIIAWASCRLSDPPVCKRLFLRFRRLLKASFAFRRSFISACNRASWCITLDVPFANWSTASKIEVGELSWCQITLLLIKELWEIAWVGLLGVWKVHSWTVPGQEIWGVGVRNLISRVEITFSRSKGTSSAPLKPPWILLSVRDTWNAARNTAIKSSLVTCVHCCRIKSSIYRLYAFFKGPKQPTSSGWSKWDEWAGIQRVTILRSLQ